MKYILAIDQGTTGTKAVLFNEKAQEVCSDYMEHKQIYPNPGWVEHNPIEIWDNIKEVTNNTLAKAMQMGIHPDNVASIGLSNQGETCMAWNSETGQPIYNAIVWQCRRTSEMVENYLNIPNFKESVIEKTGLIIDPYFSGSKMKWILDNVECAKALADEGKLMIGTLDSWMIWNITGRKQYVTDVSTAARTMLFNISTMKWDDEILNTLGIPKSILAEPVPTKGQIGMSEPSAFCGIKAPICSSMVDQPAALFGHGCFEEGMVKNTYGTGCFLYMNAGENLKLADNGMLTTIAWQVGDKPTYAYDGGVYIAGAAIQWLRDGLGIINNFSETDTMAKSVENTGGVYFVPAFSGLAAPHWDQYARGTMVGITGGTKKEHIVRATLESVALQVNDVVKSMNKNGDKDISVLRVDGGITKNDFTMQFQSDILNIPVEVSSITETTALGVAFMAGLECGVWTDLDELKSFLSIGRHYKPNMNDLNRRNIVGDWNEAVKRSLNWSMG